MLGHPKPNWILFYVDEEVDPSSVELMSLKLSPPSANLSQLLLKSYKNVVLGEAIFITASGICSVYEAEEKFRSKENHFSGGGSDTKN